MANARRFLLFASAGVALTLAWLIAPASAVNLAPPVWHLTNFAPVPANGALLLRYFPGEHDTPVQEHPPTIVVLDHYAAHIEGTTHVLPLDGTESYAVFVPTAPFAPTFPLSVFDLDILAGRTSSVEAMPLEPPTLAVELTRTTPMSVVESQCCTGVGGECIRVSTQQVGGIDLKLPLLQEDSVAQQFLYRATLTTPASSTPVDAWQAAGGDEPAHWHFQPSILASEYCYRIEAYRAIDGEIFVIDEACVSADATLVHTATDAEPTSDLDLASCSMPPAQLTPATRASGCSAAAPGERTTQPAHAAFASLVLALGCLKLRTRRAGQS